MRQRGPLLIGGLILLVALLVVLQGPQQAGSSPEHSSNSDAPDGTSALRLYAGALGHRAGQIQGTFDLPQGKGIIFVFSPLPQFGFSNAEATALDGWVRGGGVLVYASEGGDPQLDQQLAIRRQPVSGSGTISVPAPLLAGVHRLDGARSGGFRFQGLSPQQVPILRDPARGVLAFVEQRGSGRLLAMADPLLLCNGYLGHADNGRLAADLLGLAPPGSPSLFDEYHHGIQATSSPGNSWMTSPWGLAILWAVLVLFAGLAWRGRAFGPRIPIDPVRARSSAEYTSAVGELLRRSGARALTLATLDAATRRAIGERVGLAGTADPAAFADALRQRAPATATALTALEGELRAAGEQDGRFVAVAARLHALAFPDEERGG